MTALGLHEFHKSLGAQFGEHAGCEVVQSYGDPLAEHAALRSTVGIADLSFRGRLCVIGADRTRFLNGQVTNNIKDLKLGMGCYTALTNNKGKIQADLNIYAFAEELLLDFEPGLTAKITERLEKFIVADDVQVVDVSRNYGLLSIQGPLSATAIIQSGFYTYVPEQMFQSAKASDKTLGELYLINMPRFSTPGFKLLAPVAAMGTLADKLITTAKGLEGRACGWEALEVTRIEAGIPRYGVDMDESNLPQEAGIEECAVSYTKGCYIGQEVINRIRSFGQVTRTLRGLQLVDGLKKLPARGDKLLHDGREVGLVTSATFSPALRRNIALGYVRKEFNESGMILTVQTADGESAATIVPLPFEAT